MNWIRQRGRTFRFYLVVVVCLLLLGVSVAIAIGSSGFWKNLANISWKNYLTKPELELALKVIPIFISLAALWVAVVKSWAAIYPICLQRRNQRMLEDKFSRGPYDEATIERSTRYYIRPKCSNIDPAQERELRHALVATREDLFDKVDYFLDHGDSHRHLLVLADSGTGKTSFVLNYYAHNDARRPKRKRHRLALVPLGVKNADELIANIPNQEDIVLFLDAFDEDTKAIADHHSRIRTLMKACRNFKRVVITCRTQFFPKEEEIPIETGIARLGPRKAGERGVYEFWKLYLSPFDDEDVNHYLKKRYPIWHHRLRNKARAIALKIPLLTARPMLLAHMPDVIKSGAEIRHVYELYEIMIEAWLERETVWVDKEALREFSEQLAVNIYLNREARKMERVPREELPELAKVWGMSIPEWKLASRSLLNRDAEGNYKFAHRSIMEYLFVIRLINGDERCYEVVLTDQMKHFLVEILSANSPELQSFRDLLLGLELSAEGSSQYTEMASKHTAIDPFPTTLLSQIANDLRKEIRNLDVEIEVSKELRTLEHMRQKNIMILERIAIQSRDRIQQQEPEELVNENILSGFNEFTELEIVQQEKLEQLELLMGRRTVGVAGSLLARRLVRLKHIELQKLEELGKLDNLQYARQTKRVEDIMQTLISIQMQELTELDLVLHDLGGVPPRTAPQSQEHLEARFKLAGFTYTELRRSLREGDSRIPFPLFDSDLKGILLHNLPPDLHPFLEFIRRDGLALWYRIYALNQSTNLRLEPTPPDADQFVLKFVPLSEKTGEAQG